MRASTQQDRFEALFGVQSRAEVRSRLNELQTKLSLPQAQRLVAHARSLLPPPGVLRLGVVHTYTSELLDPWLDLAAALEGFELETYHGPYGVIHQEAHPSSGLVAHRPDVTALLLRREDLHPDLARPLTALEPAAQERLRLQALRGIRPDIRRR